MKAELGRRLRQARHAHGASLRAVAAAVGISPSMLSQVENGKIHPSVATLYAIVTHLGVSVDDVLVPATTSVTSANGGPSAPQLQRRAANPVVEMSGGVTWERLSARIPGVTVLLATYAAWSASSTEGQLAEHGGDEVAYLIEGQLTLSVETERHVLEAGDSFGFSSRRPHLYRNETDNVARGVWVVVDNEFRNTAEPSADGQIRSAADVLAEMRARR
jgi:transcriptional regulator with XRE-family HTH domain